MLRSGQRSAIGKQWVRQPYFNLTFWYQKLYGRSRLFGIKKNGAPQDRHWHACSDAAIAAAVAGARRLYCGAERSEAITSGSAAADHGGIPSVKGLPEIDICSLRD
jgi:hypothetical protein